MNELVTVTFEDYPLRTMTDEDGIMWWAAVDVCWVVDLDNPSRACDRLDEDKKGMNTSNTLCGTQTLVMINQSDSCDTHMTIRACESFLPMANQRGFA